MLMKIMIIGNKSLQNLNQSVNLLIVQRETELSKIY